MAYRFAGKQKTLALGVYPTVSLKQARMETDNAREMLAQGLDPSIHRKAEKLQKAAAQENSFQSVAMQWYEQWSVSKADRTAANTLKRLRNEVFPGIGALPIEQVTTPMLVAIVKQVGKRGALDVAGRVLSVCAQVFRYAIASGLTKDNPAIAIKPADVLPTRKVTHQAHIEAIASSILSFALSPSHDSRVPAMVCAFPKHCPTMA